MTKSKKRKSPSRAKYEAHHPVISARVPKEIRDRLIALREKGESVADVLKVGLGLIEAKIGAEDELKKRAHDEGFQAGYNKAKDRFAVEFVCSVCGESLAITDRDLKLIAAGLLQRNNWGHLECVRARARSRQSG